MHRWTHLGSHFEILSDECTYNVMSKEAISLFHSMQQAGARPDKITLVGLLSVYAAVGALELGTELDSYASKRGLYSNVYIGTALVDMDLEVWKSHQSHTSVWEIAVQE
ncbi:hypothetical protein TRIUR3_04719 [Triticum urartu]|uniref:Pentatricopeptide repeat-containing protein n=1 Tax=Triticum urartu TaxID=4572 RepID=M7ZLL5_TRIUA|nr:hypothetical protein TRIUR3_04719 [Triticum urartu]